MRNEARVRLRRPRWARRWTAVGLSLAVVAGCSDDATGPSGELTVSAVIVEPATPAPLVEGDSLKLGVTARAADGTPVGGRTVSWTSADPQTVEVTASGWVRAKKAGGPVTVTATIDGKSGQARVSVVAPNPAPRLISMSPSLVEAGSEAFILTVTGNTFIEGAEVWWNGSPRVTERVSANILKAQIEAADVAVEGEGRVEVHNPAPGGGLSQMLAMSIAPARVALVVADPVNPTVRVGETFTVLAYAVDINGRHLQRTITWTSLTENIVGVDATGRITGRNEGSGRVRAESEGRTVDVFVTVRPATVPVASVLMVTAPSAVLTGQIAQFEAEARSASGGALPNRWGTWTTDDPTVATVDANGRVTGRAKGRTVVRVNIEGKQAAAQLEVREIPTGRYHVYDWRPDLGTVLPAMADSVWTDGSGTVHPAELILQASSFVLDRDTGTYEQKLQLWITVSGFGFVGTTERTLKGRVETFYSPPGPGGFAFEPEVGAGFTGLSSGPAELAVRQALGKSPVWTYRYVAR